MNNLFGCLLLLAAVRYCGIARHVAYTRKQCYKTAGMRSRIACASHKAFINWPETRCDMFTSVLLIAALCLAAVEVM